MVACRACLVLVACKLKIGWLEDMIMGLLSKQDWTFSIHFVRYGVFNTDFDYAVDFANR